MATAIKYIELKTGFSDDGPAWISKIELSKSGQTIYFDNRALKRFKTPSIGANHFDIETGEEYWISGVKKNGLDRHLCGGGKMLIDEDIIDEYLKLVNFDTIDKRLFQIININKDFDKSRFNILENIKGELKEPIDYRRWYWDNNMRKLVKE